MSGSNWLNGNFDHIYNACENYLQRFMRDISEYITAVRFIIALFLHKIKLSYSLRETAHMHSKTRIFSFQITLKDKVFSSKKVPLFSPVG